MRAERGARALALIVVLGAAGAGAAAPAADAAGDRYREAEALLATRRPADLAAALELFQEAARLDPVRAEAHAGAATAASLLALYSVAPPRPLFATARAAAAAALELDPELGQAWAARGLVSYLDAWDFAAAERDFERAHRLAPGYANAWHWHGMMLQATGSFDRSLAAFDRAVELEPAAALYQAKRAGVLLAAGRTGAAERELESVTALFPGSGLAQRELGYLRMTQGRTEEALAALRRAAELGATPAGESAELGWGLARAGRRAEAEAVLARLLARAGRAPGGEPAAGVAAGDAEFVSPLDLALVYAGLGQRDQAFRELAAALELRDPALVYLATAPGFAPLHDDPRFEPMLRAIGLPSPSRSPRGASGVRGQPDGSGGGAR